MYIYIYVYIYIYLSTTKSPMFTPLIRFRAPDDCTGNISQEACGTSLNMMATGWATWVWVETRYP